MVIVSVNTESIVPETLNKLTQELLLAVKKIGVQSVYILHNNGKADVVQ